MGPEVSILFRPLTENDLPHIFTWVNLPHIVDFYAQGEEYTYQEVIDNFHPDNIKKGWGITPEYRASGFIIVLNNQPIGFIQKYHLVQKQYPANIPWEDSMSFDLFVGEEHLLGKGLGTKILATFIYREIFQKNPEIKFCYVSPKDYNERMIAVNKKLGFKFITTIDYSDQDTDYLMRVDRNNFIRIWKEKYSDNIVT